MVDDKDEDTDDSTDDLIHYGLNFIVDYIVSSSLIVWNNLVISLVRPAHH